MNFSGTTPNQNQYTNNIQSDAVSLNGVHDRMRSFTNTGHHTNNVPVSNSVPYINNAPVSNTVPNTHSAPVSNTVPNTHNAPVSNTVPNTHSIPTSNTVPNTYSAPASNTLPKNENVHVATVNQTNFHNNSSGVPISVYSQQRPHYRKYQYENVYHDRARIRFRNNFMYKPNEHPPLNPKTIFTSIFSTGTLLAFICFLAIYIIFFSIFGVFYKFSTLDVIKSRSIDATVILCLIFAVVYFYYTLPKTYQDYFISYVFLLFKDEMNDPNAIFEVAIWILLLYFFVTLFGFPMTQNEKPVSIEIIEFKLWIYLFMLVFIMFFVFILHIEIVDLVYYIFFNWFIEPLPGEVLGAQSSSSEYVSTSVQSSVPQYTPMSIPFSVNMSTPVAVNMSTPVAVSSCPPCVINSSGTPGPPGTSGPSGPPGSSGPSGAPSSSEPPGTSGPSGTPGPSGPSGTPGPSGPYGAPGSSATPYSSIPNTKSVPNENNAPQSIAPYTNIPVSNIPVSNIPQSSDCCSKIADLIGNKFNAVQPQIVYGQPQPIVLQYMNPSVPVNSGNIMTPGYANQYQDMFQTSTLSVPSSSVSASSGNNLDKLSQMTISQIISGSTQALNQWISNENINTKQSTTNTCNNTSVNPNIATTNSNTNVVNASVAKVPAPAPVPVAKVPGASEGFESMYIYDTQSMNSFKETPAGINKKKNNLTSSSGDYTTDSYKIISKSDEVQPKTYDQIEIENKVKYWDKNQDKLSVANSTNLKSWSQYT